MSRDLHHVVSNDPRLGSSKKFWRTYIRNPRYNDRKIYNQQLLPEKPLDSYSSSGRILVPAGFLLVAGAVMLIHYNDEKRAIPKGQGTDSGGNALKGPKIGGPFTLVDTKGHLITERNLLGSWTLLYFGYTSSPDVGPAEVQKMAKAIETLESKQDVKVIPIFVTIDPERDSSSQLRAYLKEFDQRIVGLTGPVSAIRQMAQEYRVFFKKVEEEGDDYLVESSHNMYLLDPNLEIVRCFGIEYDTEQLSEAIAEEIYRKSKQVA